MAPASEDPGPFGLTRRANRRRTLGCLALIVVLAFALAIELLRGVDVQVVNAGTTALRELHVEVTGRTYALGDLAPGAEVEVRVQPRGETAVLLRFLDAEGVERELEIDCYFDTGRYHGVLRITVADGEPTAVEDRIQHGWF